MPEERIEEEEVQTEQPDRAWSALDDEIEIVDEEDVEPEPEEEGPSVDELKERLAQYEQKSTGTNEQLAQSLGELGSVLKDLKSQPTNTQTQQQQVQESIDEIKKRLSDKYYDAPLDTVDEYVKALMKDQLSPVLNQFAQKINETQRGFTKSKVETKETGKLVLEKYGDEVEALVTSQNIDYEQAVKQVSADHLDEIIEMKVANAIEAQSSKDDEPAEQPKNKNPSRTQGARPKEGPQKLVVPRRVRQELEAEADARGIEASDYIAYVKRTAPERLKGGK